MKTYTQEQLEAMSNEQLSHLVSSLVISCDGLIYRKDYCNNWADIGPLIADIRITVTPYQIKSQGWFATTDTSFFVDDDNPLRAAAIVYILIKQGEQ